MIKSKKDSLIIFGKHAVREMLERDPGHIIKISLRSGLDAELTLSIKNLAAASRIAVEMVSAHTLDHMTDGAVHQGVAARVSRTEFMELKEWLASVESIQNPCVLILDELEDPHNVGAIIRTATALGAHGVILGKYNQAQVTGTVYKTSAGTIGRIPLMRVANINDTIKKLQEAHFWVIGLDARAPKKLWQEKFDTATCFVIGAEGKGIRDKTATNCDYTVSIPMDNDVESLNASVSAALVLYEWKRSRK